MKGQREKTYWPQMMHRVSIICALLFLWVWTFKVNLWRANSFYKWVTSGCGVVKITLQDSIILSISGVSVVALRIYSVLQFNTLNFTGTKSLLKTVL